MARKTKASKRAAAAAATRELSPVNDVPQVAPAAIESEYQPAAVAASGRGDLNRFLPRDIPDVVAKQSFLMNEYQAFLTGLMFFTRLPCPHWVDHNLYWISQSTVYFPFIGVIVGLFGAATFAVTSFIWHPALGVLFSTLATVWLTGAFHEDGVADCFDAFGGGWGRSEILRIMRDSRIGTYGCIGLLLVVLSKLSGLLMLLVPGAAAAQGWAHLIGESAAWSPLVLVVGHVMGRWACVYLLFAHKYLEDPTESAPGKHFVLSVSRARLLAGSASAFVFTWVVLRASVYHLALVWVLASVATMYAGRYIVDILGGVVGDALGATNQIIEVVSYLALAARPLAVMLPEVAAMAQPATSAEPTLDSMVMTFALLTQSHVGEWASPLDNLMTPVLLQYGTNEARLLRSTYLNGSGAPNTDTYQAGFRAWLADMWRTLHPLPAAGRAPVAAAAPDATVMRSVAGNALGDLRHGVKAFDLICVTWALSRGTDPPISRIAPSAMLRYRATDLDIVHEHTGAAVVVRTLAELVAAHLAYADPDVWPLRGLVDVVNPQVNSRLRSLFADELVAVQQRMNMDDAVVRQPEAKRQRRGGRNENAEIGPVPDLADPVLGHAYRGETAAALVCVFRHVLRHPVLRRLRDQMLSRAAPSLAALFFDALVAWTTAVPARAGDVITVLSACPRLSHPPLLVPTVRILFRRLTVAAMTGHKRILTVLARYFALPVSQAPPRPLFEEVLLPLHTSGDVISLMLALAGTAEGPAAQGAVSLSSSKTWLHHFLIPIFDLLSCPAAAAGAGEPGSKKRSRPDPAAADHRERVAVLFRHFLENWELSMQFVAELRDPNNLVRQALLSAVAANAAPSADAADAALPPATVSPLIDEWTYRWTHQPVDPRVVAALLAIDLTQTPALAQLQARVAAAQVAMALRAMRAGVPTSELAADTILSAVLSAPYRASELMAVVLSVFGDTLRAPAAALTIVHFDAVQVTQLCNTLMGLPLEFPAVAAAPVTLGLFGRSGADKVSASHVAAASAATVEPAAWYLAEDWLAWTRGDPAAPTAPSSPAVDPVARGAALLLTSDAVKEALLNKLFHVVHPPVAAAFLDWYQRLVSAAPVTLGVPLSPSPKSVGDMLVLCAHPDAGFAHGMVQLLVAFGSAPAAAARRTAGERMSFGGASGFPALDPAHSAGLLGTLVPTFFREIDRLTKKREATETLAAAIALRRPEHELAPQVTALGLDPAQFTHAALYPPIPLHQVLESPTKSGSASAAASKLPAAQNTLRTALTKAHLRLEHLAQALPAVARAMRLDLTEDPALMQCVFDRLRLHGVSTAPAAGHGHAHGGGDAPAVATKYDFPNPYLLQVLAEVGAGPAFYLTFGDSLAELLAQARNVPQEIMDRAYTALYAMVPGEDDAVDGAALKFPVLVALLASVLVVSNDVHTAWHAMVTARIPVTRVSRAEYAELAKRLLIVVEKRAASSLWWCTVEALVRRKVPSPA
ncbi:hypothetical protein H9P43_004579 [Blastocladiella emersonii ATCC 22665]|nr:hypothetical protein H9P43_004579 [Blastocladiella emersonii ATCC 22665]